MIVEHDIELDLRLDDVLRRQGGPRGRRPSAAVLARTEAVLAEAAGQGWLRPALALDVAPVARIDGDTVVLADGQPLAGRMLARRFAGASHLVLALATLGAAADEEVGARFARGDALEAVLLDAVANAAMDALGREVCRRAGEAARARGLTASGGLSPGLHGIPLTNQGVLHERLDGGSLGVSLSAGGMLVPVKSATQVLGLGPALQAWDKAQVCAWCHLSASCAYRQTAGAAGGAP